MASTGGGGGLRHSNSSRLSRMSFSGGGSDDARAQAAAAPGGDLSPDRDEQFASYHVHIPATPDNQPMDPAISARVEEQYVSNSLFTGGFNSVTRAHLMDKTIVFVWAGLLSITISLLWVAINPPSQNQQIGGSFTFP
ncbi:Putative cellulose synthase-like family protein [Zea mays]|uniref:Putative cellulose synthase-like family protein n=1 Tax=Zea mays TaxID=4577 RepID=A0A1D6NWY8_MAIZE|nr:Putative cellulose synthase-like family protein [Zea mays]